MAIKRTFVAASRPLLMAIRWQSDGNQKQSHGNQADLRGGLPPSADGLLLGLLPLLEAPRLRQRRDQAAIRWQSDSNQTVAGCNRIQSEAIESRRLTFSALVSSC